MGCLYYGSDSYAIEIADRPLAHLQIAMLSLLRAGRSIAFSFNRSAESGTVRETVWISPATELRFRFAGSRPPMVNDRWVRSILATAGTPAGLRLPPEPEIEPRAFERAAAR